eukprot:4285619-Alexandrium_andersonii.AAC.1
MALPAVKEPKEEPEPPLAGEDQGRPALAEEPSRQAMPVEPDTRSLAERRRAAGVHVDAVWLAIWAIYDHLVPVLPAEQRDVIRARCSDRPEELLAALLLRYGTPPEAEHLSLPAVRAIEAVSAGEPPPTFGAGCPVSPN